MSLFGQAWDNFWKARKTAQAISNELQSASFKEATKDETKNQDQVISDLDTDLTLLLLFPLIESQSRVDSSLKQHLVTIMTSFFLKLTPMSMKGDRKQLDSIEKLVLKWYNEDPGDIEVLSLFLLLACARDSIGKLLKCSGLNFFSASFFIYLSERINCWILLK